MSDRKECAISLPFSVGLCVPRHATIIGGPVVKAVLRYQDTHCSKEGQKHRTSKQTVQAHIKR